MTTSTRTQDDIYAEITRVLTTAVLARDLPDPGVMSALWYEMGRVATPAGAAPAWAQVAAMMLGDRYAADARTRV